MNVAFRLSPSPAATALVRALVRDDPQEGAVRLSSDPGRFLCDFIYFASLAEAARAEGKGTPVLFMHVPPAGHPHSVGEMRDAAVRVVRWVCENHLSKD